MLHPYVAEKMIEHRTAAIERAARRAWQLPRVLVAASLSKPDPMAADFPALRHKAGSSSLKRGLSR